VVGVAILVLTRSRISLLSGLVIAAIIAIAAGWRWAAGRIARWLPVRPHALRTGLASALTALAMLGLVVSAAVGAAAWIRRTDPRMAGLADIAGRVPEAAYFYPNEAGYEIANRLAFAERLVYWTAALRTFGQFPVLGVGPGNAGFFFEENRPAYGYQLTEIRNVLNDLNSGFPNPKNLWARILAENGIIGFSAFAAWFGLMGIAGLWLWRQGRGAESAIGLAGALGCAAQVVEGFSLDTYALPHFWVLLGLVSAAAWNRQRAAGSGVDPS
jgi:O-antigen ligase